MPVIVVHQPRFHIQEFAGEAEGVGGCSGGGALAEGAVGVGVGGGPARVAELEDVAVAVGDEVADGRPECGQRDHVGWRGLDKHPDQTIGIEERRAVMPPMKTQRVSCIMLAEATAMVAHQETTPNLTLISRGGSSSAPSMAIKR